MNGNIGVRVMFMHFSGFEMHPLSKISILKIPSQFKNL